MIKIWQKIVFRIAKSALILFLSANCIAAQEKTPVQVGIISAAGPDQRSKPHYSCFENKLKDLGLAVGRDAILKYKFAAGDKDNLARLADELIKDKVSIIVSVSTIVTQIVAKKEHEIPIVFGAVSDPVAAGIVTNLARPSKNVTGISNNLTASTRKVLEIIKSINPEVSTIALLRDQKNQGKLLEEKELLEAASDLNLTLVSIDFSKTVDKTAAFSKIEAVRPQAIIILHDIAVAEMKKEISSFALKNGIILAGQLREYPENGAFFSYGLSYCQHFERIAVYVSKIIRGSKPQDLPIELPTTFELVINKSVADTLQIKIPLPVMAASDEIIE